MSKSEKSIINPGYQQELSRISELFENTRINYQVLDEEGRICFVNQPWLNTLGYKREDILGSPFIALLERESVSAFQQKFTKRVDWLDHEDLELTLKCADKSEIIASFSCFCKAESLETSQQFHCTFQNITRLKNTEKALRTSEANYERIFNSFRDVYYRTDPESRILLVSPSVKNVCGYLEEEVTGRSVGDFFAVPGEREKFRAKIIENGFVDDYELKIIKKGGEYLNASISAQIIREKDSDDFYVEGVIRDISLRKKKVSKIETYNERMMELTNKLPVVLFQLIQEADSIKFVYLSANVNRILHIPAEDFLKDASTFTSLLSKKTFNEILDEFSRARMEKRTAEIEFEIETERIESLWCRIKASTHDSDPGQIVWSGVAVDITEEISSKQKIKEQEQQLKSLQNYASVGIATMSLSGVVSSVNPAITEISGYSENELLGKHFKDIPVFSKRDMPKYMRLFASALEGKVPDKGVFFEWNHSSGEKRWAEAYLNLIKEKGKIKGFQGVFLDTTDRIMLEKERIKRHKDGKFLFDSALGFLAIQTEDEFYKFLSKQLRKLLPEAIINLNSVNDDQSRLRVESLTGLSWSLRSGILKLIGGSLNGRQFAIDKDTFRYAKHGKLIQINSKLYDLVLHQIPKPLCNQIEKLIRLREIHEISLGIGDCIMGGCAIFLCSDQKLENVHLIENLFRQATSALSRLQTLRKLEVKEELYRSLAENSQNMLLRVNNLSEVVFANQAFLETFGLKIEDILNQPLKLRGFPSAFCDLIHQTIEKTITSRQPQSCDNVLQLDDSPRFLEWRMFPENSEKKGEGSIIMFVYDITRRKESEARSMADIEDKNKILRLIGHDLKNPFQSILGFLDILTQQYDTLSDELKIKYLEYIRDSSQKLHLLLLSLQEWSAGNDQQDHFNPVFFDLKDLIDSSIEITRLCVLDKKLTIQNNIPANTLIKADYNMIGAALRNFLANACKFSFEGGKIEFNLTSSGKEVVIELRDYGTGMSKEELKQLLESGKSFSRAGTQGETGSGMGFRFAKDFIERNKGWIKMKSQPGSGTQVFIGLKAK